MGKESHGTGKGSHGTGKGSHGTGKGSHGMGKERHGTGKGSHGTGKGSHGMGKESHGSLSLIYLNDEEKSSAVEMLRLKEKVIFFYLGCVQMPSSAVLGVGTAPGERKKNNAPRSDLSVISGVVMAEKQA